MKIADLSHEVTCEYVGHLNAAGDDGYSIDPATIMIIMEIVSNVIAMWKDCKKPPVEAAASAKSPSRFERLVLRRTCVKMLGAKEFRRSGDVLMSKLVEKASSLTESNMAEMYEDEEDSAE